MLSKLPAPLHNRGSCRVVPSFVPNTTVLAGLGCAAQNTAYAPSAEAPRPALQALTAEQLWALIARGIALTIVDLRMPRDYLVGHIPAAVSLA
jgi:hypothetical protein